LLRKKYLEEQAQRHGGIAKYDEILVGKDYGHIENHTKQLIYRTVKHIGLHAKEEQKKQNLLRINIEWAEFQQFSPLQVIGLMLLRDDVNQKM
jgi:hypothetical protein